MATAKTKVAWSEGILTSGGGVAATIAEVRSALGSNNRPAKKRVATGKLTVEDGVKKLMNSRGEVRELRLADLRKFRPASEVLPVSLQGKLGVRGQQIAPTKKPINGGVRP